MSNQKPNIEKLKNDRDVNGLIKLLSDEDHSIREATIFALGEIGDASCALPLAQRLQDNYLDIRVAACNTLIKMGDKVVETLIEVLKDENHIVREGAVQALEKISDTRAIYPLIEALKDTRRKAISDALRSIGPASFAPLIEALKNEDSRIRMGAALILGEMKDSEAIEPLLKATKDKDISVRRFAHTAIHIIKGHNRKTKLTRKKSTRTS